MSERPQLWMLLGGNGTGKSTFYRLALELLGLPFVNADLLTRIVFPQDPEAHSDEAAQLVERQRLKLLQEGEPPPQSAPRLVQGRPAGLHTPAEPSGQRAGCRSIPARVCARRVPAG